LLRFDTFRSNRHSGVSHVSHYFFGIGWRVTSTKDKLFWKALTVFGYAACAFTGLLS